ncbi:MAG: hypothetical protein ACKOFW_12730 [Planctomycetaceae bacterium]
MTAPANSPAALTRWGWLGDDPAGLPLALALARTPSARLVRAGLCAPLATPLASVAPGLQLDESWGGLLAPPELDGVIISGNHPAVFEGARELARSGARLLLLMGASQSELLFAELGPLQAEFPERVVPVFPFREWPAWQGVAQWLAGLSPGTLRQVRFERTVPPAAGDPLLATLERHFLEDVAVLRALLGSFEQVTAQLHLAPNGELVSAVTTLGGPNLPLVLWSAQPGQQAGFQLVAVAGDEEVRLHTHGGQCHWHAPGQPAQAWPLDQLAQDAAHRLLHEGLPPGPAPGSAETSASRAALPPRVFPRATWDDLLRGVELQAVVQESIRRRRTVDVLFERPSERGQFKSKMAAAGCGLLLWTPLAMVLYLVVAATLPLSRLAQLLLVLAVFAPLGLFLGLQTLLVFTRPAAADDATDRAS